MGTWKLYLILLNVGRILVGIQETVEAQMSYYDELVGLENLICHFLRKVNVPKKKYSSDYCIEKLVFL